MKVSDTDTGNEGSPYFDTGGSYIYSARPTCDPDHYRTVTSPARAADWPFSTEELDHYYQTTTPLDTGGNPTSEPDYTMGVWALNDAEAMVTVMDTTDQNLYIADVSNHRHVLNTWGWVAAENHCNWFSWAAMNDVIQYRLDNDPNQSDLYTGMALGVGGADLVNRWGCTYKDFVERARQEADEHPDIVKMVYFDELWRMMVGPETVIWQDGAHWTLDNVEALADMAQSGTYGGPDTDYYSTSDSSCDASTVGIGGNQDVELWSRMFSPGIPRYIVPSSILGLPADPAAVAGGSGSTASYGFSSDDELSVKWNGLSDTGVFTYPSSWEVYLEFLYADGDTTGAADQGLKLVASINGTDVQTATLYGKETTEVHFATVCIESSGGTGCPYSVWNTGPLNPNEIKVALFTTHTSTDLDVDRTAYVWGVRVVYIDLATGDPFFTLSYPDPDLATYQANDNGTTGTLGSNAFAQSNADPHPTDTALADGWRVTEFLDGVAVTQHHGSTQFDSLAFDRMMEHACRHLANDYATAKGCMVDEQGAAFGDGSNPTAVYTPYPTDEAWYRMSSGDEWGDGVISHYLPLSLENVGMGMGRYTERGPLNSSYGAMVYEPRLTHSLIGEVHEWSWTVPSGCAGDYDVDRALSVGANQPVMEWYIDLGVVNQAFGLVQSSSSSTGTTNIRSVLVGDVITVGWRSRGGGESPMDSNNVQFAVASSSPCTPAASAWSHSTSIDTGTYPEVEDLYLCITDYFMDPATAGTTGHCF